MFVEADKVKEGSDMMPMDPHLIEKLLKELPGIFNWAVEGLMRLLENNAFTPLEDSDQLILEFAQANNHLYCFVDEELGSFSQKTHRSNIFTAYRNWADAFGINPLPANRFYSNLKSVLEALGYKVEQQGRFWTIFGDLPKPPESEEQKKYEEDEEALWAIVNKIIHAVADTFRALLKDRNYDGQALTDIIEAALWPHIKKLIQEIQGMQKS